MTIDTNQAFLDESRKRAKSPIYLYTIEDPAGDGNDLNFAGWDTDITFNGVEYQKFPITHDEISENASGELPSTSVQVSNISRLIEAYLQSYDLRGKKVTIKMVYANLLDDPDCYVEFSRYIDSYTSNVRDVVFTLMSKLSVIGVQVPLTIFSTRRCQHLFKGTRCGYAGAETECNHTRARCRVLGNQTRFGAQPGIRGNRSYG